MGCDVKMMVKTAWNVFNVFKCRVAKVFCFGEKTLTS
jgi:hypothetical protein